jgi:hypothetical protein
VQLPARQVNIGDQCVATEDFTVEVLDQKGALLSDQRITMPHINVCAKSASKHINVQFSRYFILVETSMPEICTCSIAFSGIVVPSRGAIVRVVFHSSPGKYPSTCASLSLNQPPFFDASAHELVKIANSFVCSLVMEN